MLPSDIRGRLAAELDKWWEEQCVSHAKKFGSTVSPDQSQAFKELCELEGMRKAISQMDTVLRRMEGKKP